MPPGGFAIWNDGAAAADAAIGGTFPRRGSDGTMAPMNEPQGKSRRQRLQALLSIPEKERTEVQWDEINELEIGLASGNRSEGGEHGPSRGGGGGGGGGGWQMYFRSRALKSSFWKGSSLSTLRSLTASESSVANMA